MSDLSRSEIERGIVQDDERVEIAAIKQAEVPISEPVPTEEGGREFSADLSVVMSPPGGVIISDTPAKQDEHVEFHVERGGPGQPFVGVPDDEGAARGPVAVDRAPFDDDFQTATVRPDDTAAEDAGRRAEFDELSRSQREAEIAAKLKAAEYDLKLARAGAKADELARKLAQ